MLIRDRKSICFKRILVVLKWTSTQSGKISFNPRNLEFTDICNQILETLNSYTLAKNITIYNTTKDQVYVYADNDMLKTVMRNLVSNAIKFTPIGGSITISAVEKSGITLISVSDNGVGIEPERLIKLFDISLRHTTKGTEQESGTGLGLIICKEFVEKSGGKIWVESDYGKG